MNEAPSKTVVADKPIHWREFMKKLGVKLIADRQNSTLAYPQAPVLLSDLPNTPIAEGSRNTALASIAGQLRHRGAGEDTIARRLVEINSTHVSTPLPEDEVLGIARSIAKYPPGVPTTLVSNGAAAEPFDPFNDTANARRLVVMNAPDLVYVPEWKDWLLWRDEMWVCDNENRIRELAKRVGAQMLSDAQLIPDKDDRKAWVSHGRKAGDLPRIKAMVELASSDPKVVRSCDLLDTHDDLFSVSNGVIELSSGKCRSAVHDELITRHSEVTYDSTARCPTWHRFLNRVLGNQPAKVMREGGPIMAARWPHRKELKDYVQRVVGYGLSGLTDEQVMFFLHGSGANGKTTFVRVLEALLGPALAKQIPYDSLVAQKGPRSATNDIARLQGARAVFTNEVEDGSQLAESLIKQLTGSDTIIARHLYKDFFEFAPKFKLYMLGNHQPIIKGTDTGMWRRIQLVPFTETIPIDERDPALLQKLLAELPGILNWALEGHRRWRHVGLRPPRCVVEASKTYRQDMDLLGRWLKEHCIEGPDESCRARPLYDNYRLWAEQDGLKPMSNAAFGRKLSERFKKKRPANGHVYHGIGLRRASGGQMGV